MCLELNESVHSGRLLLLDCLNVERMWRSVQLRGKRGECLTCGEGVTVTLQVSLLGHESVVRRHCRALPRLPSLQSTSDSCPDEVYPQLQPREVIEAKVFFDRMLEIVRDDISKLGLLKVKCDENGTKSLKEVLVDVRKALHYANIRIEGSKHLELQELLNAIDNIYSESDEGMRLEVRSW